MAESKNKKPQSSILYIVVFAAQNYDVNLLNTSFRENILFVDCFKVS